MPDFDVIVVGGGPAGVISALKCSQLGLNALLIEQGDRGRHKPCGGVLTPTCVETLQETLKTQLPQTVTCSPRTLGLYYVPPNGRREGGRVRNYKLLNINRDLLDSWLLSYAIRSGVEVWTRAKFLDVRKSKPIEVLIMKNNHVAKMTTKYLIGADGVYSRVRRQLRNRSKSRTITILQEYCHAEGEFEDCFYMFFRESISPTYSYLIPKDGLYLIGVGLPRNYPIAISEALTNFKNWLSEDFVFKLLSSKRKETWAIPYGSTFTGIENIILVGDAAGFCNALSGEGIRLAVESGIAAGEAVQDAMSTNTPLALTYAQHVDELTSFIHQTYKFAISLTDERREEFIKSELARLSLR
ncbi:NAD(P)/FAD-dependent oxidoreductase [Candidatus Bathyarchaeota archaeon]|nr:NAD(P)/FAD-dependent oxidoreductase [Candidatus Bathyarchaeota archaeon]